MRFCGFCGNAALKDRLSRLFGAGRAPHAILLEGPAGVGKKRLARVLAAAFLCRAEGERPCGVCPSCVKAFSGNHPDIRTVSGGKGPRSFSVDAVRSVRADAFVAPNEGACKVYILTDVQTMSDAAQNALLKILEEPPAYVRFVLTCLSRELMLETVISRCTVFSVQPASVDEAAGALAALDGISPEQARRAARLAEGNIGRAREALKDGGLDKAARLMDGVAQALAGRSDFEVAGALARLDEKELFGPALSMLPLIFRDAAALSTGGRTLLSGCAQAAQTLSRGLTFGRLFRMQRAAASAAAAAERYANRTLLLTVLAARLNAIRSSPDAAPIRPAAGRAV